MEMLGRILQGIRISPPGRKTHTCESGIGVPTLESKFTLLYHLSIHHLLIIPILGWVRGFTRQP